MLTIEYGKDEGFIRRGSYYFDNVYEDAWFEDRMVQQMILDVDRSEVKSPHLIESPVLGPIGPKDLSGGVKTLILMLKQPDKIFNASSCGDNCAKWIVQIAAKQDLRVALNHAMDFGSLTFDAVFLPGGRVVHNMKELIFEIVNYEVTCSEG